VEGMLFKTYALRCPECSTDSHCMNGRDRWSYTNGTSKITSGKV
jgi:hypothetical protein